MARFMAVGILGFVVDAVTFYVFSRVFDLSLLVAQACSFTVAVVHNFFWNRHWTFPEARRKSLRRQLTQFYVTSVAGLVIRSVTIALVASPFHRLAVAYPLSSLPPKLVSDYAALSTAVLIVFVWNYVVNRIWTFSEVA